MVRVQDVLAGRYELLDVLGRGGMGVVYRATDRVLARPVAVKILPVDRAENPSLVLRFEREALAAAALNHPNVVAVYDTGREDDTRFIVMEYVEGLNVAQLLRERGPLTPGETAAIGAQIASAMAAAHTAGLIHRDIKPANVMVDPSERVKVLDFGIARAVAGTALTQTATVLGSAPYLAPEVASGHPADERSDVYSLGCVLYEMLSGRPPFTGDLPAAIMHQHGTAAVRPLHEIDPSVPPALAGLVMRMLAKRPDDRPADGEVVQALSGRQAPTGATAPLATAATAALRTGATMPLPPETTAAASARAVDRATPMTAPTRALAGQIPHAWGRRGAVIAAVAVLVATVAALAVAGAFRSSAPSSRSTAPSARSAPARTTSAPPTSTTTQRPLSATTPTTAPAPAAPTQPPPAPPSAGNGHAKPPDKGADGKGPKGPGGAKPPKPAKPGKP